MNKEEIKNNQIPKEIKEICLKCEQNIHCQNKGCAFRSLGNEFCDEVDNATKLYLKQQQALLDIKDTIEISKHSTCVTRGGEFNEYERSAILQIINDIVNKALGDKDE